VAVGSTNPIKVKAVRRVMAEVYGKAEVKGFPRGSKAAPRLADG